MLKPFSEDITTGSEDYTEIKLNLSSKQWQDLRKEIAHWKRTGGTLHAKMTGKSDVKEVKELIAKRGPNLTEEEEARLYQTPGIIPPWYPKNPNEESYFYHAMKAIRELDVSAAEVLAAVDKEYDDESTLTEKQRRILLVGWGQEFAEKSKVIAAIAEKKALFSKELAEWIARHAGLRLTSKVLSTIGKFLMPAINVIWTAEIGWDAYKFLKARPGMMSDELIKALKEGRVSEENIEKVRTAFYLLREKKMKPAEVKKVMEKYSEKKNVIPYGEFYHKDIGWY